MLDAARARELLQYDPSTGDLRWRVTRGRAKVGELAGSPHVKDGRRYVFVDRGQYTAHRLAWLITHGEWPTEFLDHKDGDPTNNRLDNLRPATRTENARNRRVQKSSSTGLKGVVYDKRKKSRPWKATIYTDGRHKSLGYHDTPEQAHAAYAKAATEHHGEFACLRSAEGSKP